MGQRSLALLALSDTPATTEWLGPHVGDSTPVAIYGVVLLGAGLAYWLLAHSLVAAHGPDSRISQAIGRDAKGNLSLIAYLVGIAVAAFVSWLSIALYICVALAWLVPDRRMERVLATHNRE